MLSYEMASEAVLFSRRRSREPDKNEGMFPFLQQLPQKQQERVTSRQAFPALFSCCVLSVGFSPFDMVTPS